jgi:hypothetical protein
MSAFSWLLRPLFAAALGQDDPSSSLALDALSVPLFSAAASALQATRPPSQIFERADLMLSTWTLLLASANCPSSLIDVARVLEAPPPAHPAALHRQVIPTVGDTVVADATGAFYQLRALAPLATLRDCGGQDHGLIPSSALWFVSPNTAVFSQPLSRPLSQFRDVLTAVADPAGYLLADVDIALVLAHFHISVTPGWRSIALLDYTSRSHLRLRIFYRLTSVQLAYEDANISSSLLSQLLPVIRAGHAGVAPLSDFQPVRHPSDDITVLPVGLVDADVVADAPLELPAFSISLPTSDDAPYLAPHDSRVVQPLVPVPLPMEPASVVRHLKSSSTLRVPDVACTCGRIRGKQGRHALICDITRTRANARVNRLYNPDADPAVVPFIAPHPLPPAHPIVVLPPLEDIIKTRIRLLNRVPHDARPAWSEALRIVLRHVLTQDPNRWLYYFMLPKIVLRLPSQADGATGFVVAQRCRLFTAHFFANVPSLWDKAILEITPESVTTGTSGPFEAGINRIPSTNSGKTVPRAPLRTPH